MSSSEDESRSESRDSSEQEEQEVASSSKKVKRSIKKARAVMHHRNRMHQFYASKALVTEIKRLQHSTKLTLPRLPFARLIKEIANQYGDFHFQSKALEAIQESTELFMIGFMSDSYQLTRHRKRQTLSVPDMQLLSSLVSDLIPSLQPT